MVGVRWRCRQQHRRLPRAACSAVSGSRATTRSSIGLPIGTQAATLRRIFLHQERHCGARRSTSRRRRGRHVAPKWYDTPAAQLPHTPKDDKRRHFVRARSRPANGCDGVDILMTHEAPRPFIVSAEGDSRPAKRWDAGKRPINELLAAVRPRLHLCGHHHRFAETDREGVRSVCIDRINRSYLLIDASTLKYQKIEQ